MIFTGCSCVPLGEEPFYFTSHLADQSWSVLRGKRIDSPHGAYLRSASLFLLFRCGGTGVCISAVYTLTLILSVFSDKIVTEVKLRAKCLKLGSRESGESISDSVRGSYWLKYTRVLFTAGTCCSPPFMVRFFPLAAKAPLPPVLHGEIEPGHGHLQNEDDVFHITSDWFCT